MLTYLSGYIKERRESVVDISILFLTFLDAVAGQMSFLLFLLLQILTL